MTFKLTLAKVVLLQRQQLPHLPSVPMNYIFGPVNSRRLGCSLGIDLFREKICSLNCIYCEVGATTCLTCERAEYAPTSAILSEIDTFFRQQERAEEVDFVTVTASGEPTLHLALGEIIAHLKRTAKKPVAVLTNGTLLWDAQVRKELALADVVIPSLDSALVAGFRKIDRPAKCLDLEAIIEGLAFFSQDFRGQLWLEILLVQGINDTDEEVAALCTAAARMRLDRIQLNTVIRPPLESFAQPVAGARMEVIAAEFLRHDPHRPVDLLSGGAVQEESRAKGQKSFFNLDRPADQQALRDEIVEMLKRRPCTAADINRVFHVGGADRIEQLLDALVRDGLLHKRMHNGRLYYQIEAQLA
ncbi:radical SAM protein [Candidatus Electronema sp. PJ]|uniref:radical SAM protein n=1 Tax=Candidatus Electronema sp. PJ TaxID=3401572 RepID=UPI003AA8E9BA